MEDLHPAILQPAQNPHDSGYVDQGSVRCVDRKDDHSDEAVEHVAAFEVTTRMLSVSRSRLTSCLLVATWQESCSLPRPTDLP